eukprot:TRINITY_DN20973_c0_g1_i1.p1 TRINITY_DN20973_c0_g1~~TRINITY_DN20973_c0_g1_i1.p1  ORF type:complete len:966 (-),score=113.98 TRINITY_DN20973_c0_g1_i1:97-2574(-)
MLSGAFAVDKLLNASSLADYCRHLRSYGHDLPAFEEVGSPTSVKELSARACWEDAGNSCDVRWPAVRLAAENNDTASLEMLLGKVSVASSQRWCGAMPRNAAGHPRFTALHASARSGAVDCLRLLLRLRAKPTVTEGGAAMTPAHYAAMGSSECLNVLLEAKAPLTVRDARGQSLIHAAARAGNCASLRLLLACADNGRKNNSNGTLRALRSGEGSRGLLEWSDRWARTAVHWATLNGHLEALSFLLESKATPTPRVITDHQMGKRTHMTQETPVAIAARVHGVDSTISQLIVAAVSAQTDGGLRSPLQPPSGGDRNLVNGQEEDSAASRYLVTIAEPRLERLAIWELQERLTASVQRTKCRIFFTSDAHPSKFLGLKAAEKICAVVFHASAAELAELADRTTIPLDAAEDAGGGRDVISTAAAQFLMDVCSWDTAMALWRRFHGLDAVDANGDASPAAPLTFKVTCRRSGKRFRHVSTQGLAIALAARLTKTRGWRAQVRQPDLEVRVLLGDADLLVDFPMLFQPAVRVGGGEICDAGMSPHVAWALARSAEPRAGECLLDPMCGRAVILIEAATTWPELHCCGVDLDAQQLLGAERNVALQRSCIDRGVGGGRASSGGNVHGASIIELLHGDAQRLPFPDGFVDAVVCDIPFGIQYSSIEECRTVLYDAVLRECDRVVKPQTGRMVLLSSLEQEAWVLRAASCLPRTDVDDASVMRAAVAAAVGHGDSTSENRCGGTQASSPWVCVARRKTPLGNLEGVILVFRRPSAVLSAAGTASEPYRGQSALPELSDRLWWETSAGRGDWSSLKVAQRPPMQLTRGREV